MVDHYLFGVMEGQQIKKKMHINSIKNKLMQELQE